MVTFSGASFISLLLLQLLNLVEFFFALPSAAVTAAAVVDVVGFLVIVPVDTSLKTREQQ